MLGKECEMSKESGAKVSVLKDLLKKMYEMMVSGKDAEEAHDESEEHEEDEGMSLADMEAERIAEGMVADPKKKKPKYALMSMTVESKPKMNLKNGKKYA